MSTKVAIAKCTTYDQPTVDRAVREVIEHLDGLKKLLGGASQVVLKVNLLAARKPEEAVCTHPAVVSSLIDIVRDLGAKPIIADSCGFACPGATRRAAQVSGIQSVADKKQVEFIPLEAAGFDPITMTNGMHVQTVYYSRLVREADVVISVPKLKSHLQTVFTGAVKNMFGCVPAAERLAAHRLSAHVAFSEAVVDIYSATIPHAAVMDAVWGMEGNGPSRGKPRRLGLIIASDDGVALDATACAIVGIDPFSVVTTQSASRRRLGEGRVEHIQLVGGSLGDFRIMNFKMPTTRFMNLPVWLVNLLYRQLAPKPIIDLTRCQRCGQCEKSCPVGGITEDDQYSVDQQKCIRCYCCHELCPNDAVILKRGILRRLVR